jgi:uncharacterized repeat protein (TIGR01451 family)
MPVVSIYSRFVLCAIVACAGSLGAQSAKLEVSVTPVASANVSAGADGFTVCVGTSANRSAYGKEVTSASGIVRDAFENLTSGETVRVTVSKTGFTGAESTITLRPGRNNSAQLSPRAGTGGPACAAGSTTAPPPPSATTPIATTVRALTTTSQPGLIGTAVAIAPAVIVRDQNSNAMSGVTVAFVVVSGGGSVTPGTVATGADGIARLSRWTLGATAGANSIVAKVTGLQAATFSATASQPAPPADTQAPSVTAPANITVNGTSTSGVTVSYTTPTATDNSGSASVICRPASGSVFPVGTTSVTCTATDAAGNSASATFSVTVLPPAPTTIVSTSLVTIALPELSVRIAQSAATIVAGTQQTYTVRVNNRGTGSANSIVLRHALPADLTYVSSAADRGFVCSRSGTTVNCASGAIAAGDSATVRIVMALALAAQSGHPVVYGATVDPANAIAESNEANNSAGASATTQAAIAPIVDYRISTLTELVEMFNLAEASGFEFKSWSTDKDALGNLVKCWIQHGSVMSMAAEAGLPLPGTVLHCMYEWFGRTKKLAAGWQLRSVEFAPPLAIFASTGFVEPPNPASGTAFFSRQLTWTDLLPMSHAYQDLTAVTLRGPVSANWRDAFK